ncbi:MBG domain-containing protein [Sulfitobacter sp. HNIBRBA3233]|uniref:MBG domain-containing protein n=1 Tax=Sulfitobacter marinivivus TaxID=3158558 RepID=UPI0032DFAA48
MVLTTRVSAFRVISASERWGARLAPLTLVILGFLHPHTAFSQDALPQGGTVAQGDVSVSVPGAGVMVLDQGSDRAVMNWDSFSIGRGNSVEIRQPDRSSAILNRVTGATTSEIHGRLSATGEVYVVNPNGLLIGKTGEVSAGGGFVGSTLDTGDDDFMAGRLRFDGLGSSAAVDNRGTITVGRGGFAALLGGRVSNSGLVMVPMGRIGFGAGERATLDLSGDRFLQIEVPSEGDGEMRALIENAGTVSAEGGSIEMRAATARHAARHAINLSGVAEARSVSVRNGVITLGGGAGGRVTVSGRVTTRAKAPRRPAIVVAESPRPLARRGGGDVTIIGRQIDLAGASIDASGPEGGGVIRIGGALRGSDGLPTALYLGVDAETTITADAWSMGDGGRVILWSDERTEFAGTISARGGDLGGDGGFVEVSGKDTLAFSGLVDSRAPAGAAGQLLLDPRNLNIDTTDSDPGASFVDVAVLSRNLESGNVTLTTEDIDLSDAGNITVNAEVAWASGFTLGMIADNDIVFNDGITAPSGGLELTADGTLTTAAAGEINVDTFRLFNGDWQQLGATLPGFSARDFALSGAIGTSFLRAMGGSGVDGDPYLLTDAFGLQGMGSDGLSSQSFALAGTIDAAGTDQWQLGLGFDPISAPVGAFTGSLDGQGNSIDDLTVLTSEIAGLFGETSGATITNLTLNNANVAGDSSVGILSGLSVDTTIDNVDVNGTLSLFGSGNFGGLVGELRGAGSTLSNSNFDGSVAIESESDLSNAIGGLVGRNFLGTISNSTVNAAITEGGTTLANRSVGGAVGINGGTMVGVGATGSVSATANGGPLYIGGLAGENNSVEGIANSSSSTTVSVTGTGSSEVAAGGLIGRSIGSTADASASGAVTVNAEGARVAVGGLIGRNQGTATRRAERLSATGDVTVSNLSAEEATLSSYIGGLVGVNAGPMTDASATGAVTVTSELVNSFVGGFAGYNEAVTEGSPEGDISVAFATGPVSYTTNLEGVVGGFVGGNAGSIEDAYSNSSVTLRMPSFGVEPVPDTYGTATGGFAGLNEGAMTRTAARGPVDNQAAAEVVSVVGGHTGANEGGTITDSYSTGALTDNSGAPLGIGSLVGGSTGGAIITSLGASTVTVGGAGDPGVEGLVGFYDRDLVTSAPTTNVVNSYWDEDAYGRTNPPGTGVGLGLSTAELQDTDAFFDRATADGWDFTVWAPGASGRYPSIYSIDRVVFAEPDPLALVYGETPDATATGSVTGGPSAYVFADAGETLDTSPIFQTLTFPDNTVGTRSFTVDTTPLTSSAAETYAVVALSGSADITPAPLEVTVNDARKTYGTGLTFDGTEFAITGGELFFADSLDTITIASAGAAAEAEVAGSPYAITGSAPVTGTRIGNYSIDFVDGALTVDPAALEVTVSDARKTYGTGLTFDGTEFAITGGELFFADSLDTITIASDGAAAEAEVAGSPYAITGSAPVTGTRIGNYSIDFVDGALTVDPATLEVTVNDARKTYGAGLTFDGTEFAITGGELFFADSLDTITIASAGAAAEAEVAGSPYAITGSAPVTGTRIGNYSIDFVEGALTVDPAPLEVTVSDARKTYGTGLSFDGTEFAITGGELFFADSLDTISIASAGAAAEAEVAGSPYAITGSAPVTGTRIGNYSIDFVEGALTVDPAALEVTVNDARKTYGTGLTFDGTEFAITGGELFFADSLDTITIASAGAAAEAEVAGSPYAITGSAPVTGTRIGNYSIDFVDGALTVDPAALEVTVSDARKTYGTGLTFDGTEFAITGGELFFADSLDTITIASDGAAAEAEVAGSPYAITGSAPVTGTRIGNYSIDFVDGALTVDPATLEVTVNDARKTYGAGLTFDGTEFAITGGELFFADSLDTITIASDGAAAEAEVAGSPYAITGAAPSGTGLQNYDISLANGALTVDPAALEITADDRTKTEGEAVAFDGTEFTARGLLLSDIVDSVTLFSEGAAVEATATDSPFAIEVLAAEGDRLENYAITFTDGALTVLEAEEEAEAPIFRPEVAPVFTLPNPADRITLSLSIGEESGPAGLGNGSGGGTPATAAALSDARETLETVQEIAGTLELASGSCAEISGDVDRYLACLSDALDDFANELDEIATDLPPGMQDVARIVRDARQNVNAARSRAQSRLAAATTDAQRDQIRRDAASEARAALDTAAAEIRKSIAFVRVDDPELASVQRATITTVAAAVDSVGIELSRATGL